MSNSIDAHLTDEVINAAFENANFGRTDFRTILAETVMKRAAGFHSGWTATTICMGLGLLSSKNQSATKLGLTFAFHHYYKPCVREALMAAMKLALVSLEAKDKIPELRQVIYHFRDWNEGFPIERFKADYVISWMLANYPPAQPTAVSVPDGYRLQPISEYDAMCAAMLQGAEPVTTLKPAIFIDGNISPDDADKLAETISNLNSEHREPQQEVK
ncbi:TPA: hypothetical protein ACGSV4_002214 [Escherichia coli]